MQIGQHVVREVLIPVMRCLWRALDTRPDYVGEVYRAATQFFSMLDPAIVFTHLAERIHVRGMPRPRESAGHTIPHPLARPLAVPYSSPDISMYGDSDGADADTDVMGALDLLDFALEGMQLTIRSRRCFALQLRVA
jgi:hypothetical protein